MGPLPKYQFSPSSSYPSIHSRYPWSWHIGLRKAKSIISWTYGISCCRSLWSSFFVSHTSSFCLRLEIDDLKADSCTWVCRLFLVCRFPSSPFFDSRFFIIIVFWIVLAPRWCDRIVMEGVQFLLDLPSLLALPFVLCLWSVFCTEVVLTSVWLHGY